MAKSILCISVRDEIGPLLDEGFRQAYRPFVLTGESIPELPGPEEPIQLLVISGYSIKEAMRKIRGLEEIVSTLPAKLPRLYLLHETDPSLSLVPLKGDQRFFYLRGPLSMRSLRKAVDQILAMKPRALRLDISPDLGIMARFSIRFRATGRASFLKDVLEISPSGFSFHWLGTDPLLYPGDILDELELRSREQTFLCTCAQVRHLTLMKGTDGATGMRVGAEFVDARSVGPDGVEMRGRAFLSDPVVIRAVLGDAVERKTIVLIRGEQPGWEVQGLMTGCDVESQELLVTQVTASMPEDVTSLDIISCQFVRDNAQLQFWSVLLEIDPARDLLRLRFPKRLDKLWARATLRFEFDSDPAPLLTIENPITPGRPILKKVVNLSPSGLCIEADPNQDLLFRGMSLRRLELQLPDGPRIFIQGEVRYVSAREGGEGSTTCGIQFRDIAPSDQHAVVNYLISKNYPNVSDAGPGDEDALWRFYVSSDFFTPMKRDACIGAVDDVRHTQAQVLHASPPFGRRLIFKDGGRIFGTVSLQQICQRTWMVHHLCAVRHATEFVPKNLLLFLGEYISKTPEIDYVKMMWRPNNTWSNKMFGKLVHRLHDGEQSVVKVYSFLFHDGRPLPSPRPEVARWNVRPIEPDEVGEVESHFINQEEYFLMKSEDLFRGALHLEQIDARYRALGLYRERRVFVAFEGEHLAGFSLAERSSPGLNMSNLLNTFQVHICYPERSGQDTLKEALIRRTLRYYHEHGQTKAVAFSEDTDHATYERIGFVKKKDYVSWTFDHNIANIYNLYCYYIFRIYERIEARRQELRARARG